MLVDNRQNETKAHKVLIAAGRSEARLSGELTRPACARGIVIVANAPSRREVLREKASSTSAVIASIGLRAEVSTLIVDLFTPGEEAWDRDTPRPFVEEDAHVRGVSLHLLAQRLSAATEWVLADDTLRHLKIGYYGTGFGAAAALVTVSTRTEVCAVVSVGGRPDLAGPALESVRVPTLFIVAESTADNDPLLAQARSARRRLKTNSELCIVRGAGPCFEGPGGTEDLARLASEWFAKHFG